LVERYRATQDRKSTTRKSLSASEESNTLAQRIHEVGTELQKTEDQLEEYNNRLGLNHPSAQPLREKIPILRQQMTALELKKQRLDAASQFAERADPSATPAR
jgi:chromosome segregation ATPase